MLNNGHFKKNFLKYKKTMILINYLVIFFLNLAVNDEFKFDVYI